MEMKRTSPAQQLARDRRRKREHRKLLRAAGLKPRQLWMSDAAWSELLPWVAAMGHDHRVRRPARNPQVGGNRRDVTEGEEQALLP